MWIRSERRSTYFPFPSSPHWVPTTTMFGIAGPSLARALAISSRADVYSLGRPGQAIGNVHSSPGDRTSSSGNPHLDTPLGDPARSARLREDGVARTLAILSPRIPPGGVDPNGAYRRIARNTVRALPSALRDRTGSGKPPFRSLSSVIGGFDERKAAGTPAAG